MEEGTGGGLLAGELKGLRGVKLLEPIVELGDPGTPVANRTHKLILCLILS